MKLPETHENQTPAQATIALGVDEIAKLAAEQGYSEPHSKAERMVTAAEQTRRAELARLFGHEIEVGNRALLLVSGDLRPAEEVKADMTAGRKL